MYYILRKFYFEFRHLAKVKVIDLTGPEQRILSGYHAISSGQKRPEDEWEMEKLQEEQSSAEKKLQVGGKSAFDMPELLHNIELLKDSCEHVSYFSFL